MFQALVSLKMNFFNLFPTDEISTNEHFNISTYKHTIKTTIRERESLGHEVEIKRKDIYTIHTNIKCQTMIEFIRTNIKHYFLLYCHFHLLEYESKLN